MNVIVRKADTGDAGMISLIGTISFRDAFGKEFDKENLEDYLKTTYNPGKIADNIDGEENIYYIAEVNNKPVGFAKLKNFSLNEDIDSFNQVQLEKIYVLPGYQNSGAGSALLREIVNIANEIGPDYLWLDVYTGNEKTIRFCERHGFKIEKKYYQGFGSRFFEFYMMVLPIVIAEPVFCN
jgi:ribosomal protein S18 acetylase RimI-like enzyme